jgi:TatD DNase family protein
LPDSGPPHPAAARAGASDPATDRDAPDGPAASAPASPARGAALLWTDSHCHVPYQGIGPEAVDEARRSGVTRLVSVGTNAAQSRAAMVLARSEPGVWATVGLHPHEATEGVASIEPLLAEADPVVVAVGECGLDYHYDHSPRPVQREAFAAQVALAHAWDLALVIHTREAWEDTFDILAAQGVPERTVFHCFTGGPEEAERALAVGAWLSFSGIVTFKTAGDVRAAAARCPLERLLVETDAPYLAPVPHRGRPNRPALVSVVGAGVAEAKGVATEVVAAATWANTAAVFRLPSEGPPTAGRPAGDRSAGGGPGAEPGGATTR